MLWKDWIFTKELTKEREREIGRRKKSRIFSSFLFFLLFFFFLRHKSTTNSILLPFLLCSSQLIRAPKGLKDGQDISGCLPRVNLCVNRLFFQNLQEGASFPGQDVIRPLRTASVPLNIQVNVIKQEGRRKGGGGTLRDGCWGSGRFSSHQCRSFGQTAYLPNTEQDPALRTIMNK